MIPIQDSCTDGLHMHAFECLCACSVTKLKIMSNTKIGQNFSLMNYIHLS
jgi:hypothetical protein